MHCLIQLKVEIESEFLQLQCFGENKKKLNYAVDPISNLQVPLAVKLTRLHRALTATHRFCVPTVSFLGYSFLFLFFYTGGLVN